MIRYLTSAAFAAVAFASAGSAMALGNPCSTCELFPPINNTQVVSRSPIITEVNAHIGSVAGNLTVSGTAVGNNLSIDAGTGTTGNIVNRQSFISQTEDIKSTVNVSGTTHANGDIAGKLTVTNTAVGNNASIKLGACCTTAPTIDNNQSIAPPPPPPTPPPPPHIDPTALTNVELNSVAQDVDIATTSVGNNLSVEGRIAAFNNVQSVSWAPINAISNVSIGTAGAAVSIAATAVGNNASFKQTIPCPVVP